MSKIARQQNAGRSPSRRLLPGIILSAIMLGAVVLLGTGPARAASVDGSQLGLIWGLPFMGILLSIALFPLLAPAIWHHHYGKIAGFWALCFLLPFTLLHGAGTTAHAVLEVALHEYIPFVILLLALFTIAGGVRITGNLHGSPGLNTALLAAGTVLASWMGTTGAAMLLIRPLLRANDDRQHNVHVVVFFIILVANVGGALTPLGDPPLFLGFLLGVRFFWTVEAMLLPMLLISLMLLAMFYALDLYLYRKEGTVKPDPTPDNPIGIEGGVNVLLLGGVVALVLMSGTWKPAQALSVFGVSVTLPNLARDLGLLALALLSLKLTRAESRRENGFDWEPIREVAKLFAGIFLTIVPVIAILRAGEAGALKAVIQLASNADGTPNNAMYFWLTGILSAFLDNAPTYLVFFNMAGGDAQAMMGPMANTLLAVSAGAVFFGALSYIGNAPNFMVKAIAEQAGVKMPSFFGYLAWSVPLLALPFLLVTWFWFIP